MQPYPLEIEQWWLEFGQNLLAELVHEDALGGISSRECGFAQAVQRKIRAFDNDKGLQEQVCAGLVGISGSRTTNYLANTRKLLGDSIAQIFRNPDDEGINVELAMEGLGYLDAMETQRYRLVAATQEALEACEPGDSNAAVVEELHRAATKRYAQFHMGFRATILINDLSQNARIRKSASSIMARLNALFPTVTVLERPDSVDISPCSIGLRESIRFSVYEHIMSNNPSGPKELRDIHMKLFMWCDIPSYAKSWSALVRYAHETRKLEEVCLKTLHLIETRSIPPLSAGSTSKSASKQKKGKHQSRKSSGQVSTTPSRDSLNHTPSGQPLLFRQSNSSQLTIRAAPPVPNPLLQGMPGREISPSKTDLAAFAGDVRAIKNQPVLSYPDDLSRIKFDQHPLARELHLNSREQAHDEEEPIVHTTTIIKKRSRKFSWDTAKLQSMELVKGVAKISSMPVIKELAKIHFKSRTTERSKEKSKASSKEGPEKKKRSKKHSKERSKRHSKKQPEGRVKELILAGSKPLPKGIYKDQSKAKPPAIRRHSKPPSDIPPVPPIPHIPEHLKSTITRSVFSRWMERMKSRPNLPYTAPGPSTSTVSIDGTKKPADESQSSSKGKEKQRSSILSQPSTSTALVLRSKKPMNESQSTPKGKGIQNTSLGFQSSRSRVSVLSSKKPAGDAQPMPTRKDKQRASLVSRPSNSKEIVLSSRKPTDNAVSRFKAMPPPASGPRFIMSTRRASATSSKISTNEVQPQTKEKSKWIFPFLSRSSTNIVAPVEKPEEKPIAKSRYTYVKEEKRNILVSPNAVTVMLLKDYETKSRMPQTKPGSRFILSNAIEAIPDWRTRKFKFRNTDIQKYIRSKNYTALFKPPSRARVLKPLGPSYPSPPIKIKPFEKRETHKFSVRQPRLSPMEYARMYLIEKSFAERYARVCELPRPQTIWCWTLHFDRFLIAPRIPSIINRDQTAGGSAPIEEDLASVAASEVSDADSVETVKPSRSSAACPRLSLHLDDTSTLFPSLMGLVNLDSSDVDAVERSQVPGEDSDNPSPSSGHVTDWVAEVMQEVRANSSTESTNTASGALQLGNNEQLDTGIPSPSNLADVSTLSYHDGNVNDAHDFDTTEAAHQQYIDSILQRHEPGSPFRLTFAQPANEDYFTREADNNPEIVYEEAEVSSVYSDDSVQTALYLGPTGTDDIPPLPQPLGVPTSSPSSEYSNLSSSVNTIQTPPRRFGLPFEHSSSTLSSLSGVASPLAHFPISTKQSSRLTSDSILQEVIGQAGGLFHPDDAHRVEFVRRDSGNPFEASSADIWSPDGDDMLPELQPAPLRAERDLSDQIGEVIREFNMDQEKENDKDAVVPSERKVKARPENPSTTRNFSLPVYGAMPRIREWPSASSNPPPTAQAPNLRRAASSVITPNIYVPPASWQTTPSNGPRVGQPATAPRQSSQAARPLMPSSPPPTHNPPQPPPPSGRQNQRPLQQGFFIKHEPAGSQNPQEGKKYPKILTLESPVVTHPNVPPVPQRAPLRTDKPLQNQPSGSQAKTTKDSSFALHKAKSHDAFTILPKLRQERAYGHTGPIREQRVENRLENIPERRTTPRTPIENINRLSFQRYDLSSRRPSAGAAQNEQDPDANPEAQAPPPESKSRSTSTSGSSLLAGLFRKKNRARADENTTATTTTTVPPAPKETAVKDKGKGKEKEVPRTHWQPFDEPQQAPPCTSPWLFGVEENLKEKGVREKYFKDNAARKEAEEQERDQRKASCSSSSSSQPTIASNTAVASSSRQQQQQQHTQHPQHPQYPQYPQQQQRQRQVEQASSSTTSSKSKGKQPAKGAERTGPLLHGKTTFLAFPSPPPTGPLPPLPPARPSLSKLATMKATPTPRAPTQTRADAQVSAAAASSSSRSTSTSTSASTDRRPFGQRVETTAKRLRKASQEVLRSSRKDSSSNQNKGPPDSARGASSNNN
ncbi:hypothetical protein PT974_03900 [Cladobotryum mycophilum]|uniref:Telomere-associated protein Rif1 N-terminal domain-containing protein n=1 Tax=Cladobotryum mycophilum TaxID=491253 RepID=A0ABR0SU81_9HYPO